MNRTDRTEFVTHTHDEEFAYFENRVRDGEASAGAVELLEDMSLWAGEVSSARHEPAATREITSFEFVASAVRKALTEDLRLELIAELEQLPEDSPGRQLRLAKVLLSDLRDTQPRRQSKIA